MKNDFNASKIQEPLFPKLEKEVLEFWKSIEINSLLLKRNLTASKIFTFYDGPPGTNGKPHIGHMLQSTLKDLYIRYKNMQGYSVFLKLGWDSHGLPVELKAQKHLNLNSKQDIINYGVDDFINYCNKIVLKYKSDWINSIERIGRIADFVDTYTTSDKSYIQSTWWALKKAWDQNLIYKSYRINAYCPRLGTSLSNQEVALGYKEVVDPSFYVKFRILKSSLNLEAENSFFLAWTTTPWTLIGNLALALSPDITYIKIKCSDEIYILSKALLEKLVDYQLIPNDYLILDEFLGSKLANIHYEPLWNFFSKEKLNYPNLYTSLLADFVDEKEGTGIVHIAYYGEEDFKIIKKENLPIIQHINLQGKFIEACGLYKDLFFDDDKINTFIEKDLVNKNLFLAKKNIKHGYPFNYKTGTRLMYYARKNWFLKTSQFKDLMIQLNSNINWKPDFIQKGRFGKWLQNNVDWNISRERFWGTPLPIWECASCLHQICIESLSELSLYAKIQFDEDFDPHIPNIDQIFIECPECKNSMKREPEVLDCWFDASIMPWGQFGYPLDKHSKVLLSHYYPSDFICEGLDQTRGWFYGLIVSASFLEKKESFKNVICTDLILDEKGEKMSKSKNNVIHPYFIFDHFGADALRWFFTQSAIGKPIRFSKLILEEILKIVLLPLWNIYKFLSIYASMDKYTCQIDLTLNTNFSNLFKKKIDLWILSEIENLNENIINDLDLYNHDLIPNKILNFIDKLSNWYIRRNRKRFWKEKFDLDKKEAYDCLSIVFFKLSCLMAPIIPYITEFFYQNLFLKLAFFKEKSIHLCNFPIPNRDNRNINLEISISKIREICHLGNSLRNRLKIKNRQALLSLKVEYCIPEDASLFIEYKHLLMEELNIKNVYAEASKIDNFTRFIVKANLKMLGPKLGKNIDALKDSLKHLSQKTILEIQKDKQWIWNYKNESVVIHVEELLFIKDDSLVKENQEFSENFKIEFDTLLTDPLLKEGLIRELIHTIQNIRKQLKFEISDSIEIYYFVDVKTSKLLLDAIHEFENDLKSETLTKKIIFDPNSSLGKAHIINNFKIQLKINKYLS